MTDLMIEARDLRKRYGPVEALTDVSFDVRKGEVLGFLGPNGAGKSTTMKILTCFIAPTEGTAKVNGADIFDDPVGVRSAIGYLPESTPLYTEMLVLEYLEFVAKMRGYKGEEAYRRIRRAVEQTSLGDVIAKEIRALSKGYRQRVGLAQALVHEPPILILDEPMSGLDPNQAAEIRDLIKEIGRERTVILSTHNLSEVHVTCNRVLIVANGRIVADDTPEQLEARAGKPRFLATFQCSESSQRSTIQAALSKIDGTDEVRSLDSDEGEATFDLLPKGDDDLRAAIFQAAVSSELVLLGLERRGENLESIFRGLTLGNGEGPSSEAGSKKASSKKTKGSKPKASKAAEAKADPKPAERQSEPAPDAKPGEDAGERPAAAEAEGQES